MPSTRRQRFKEKLKQIDADFIRRGAARMTDADLARVTQKADQISKQFSKGGPLGRFVEDARLLFAVLKDYRGGAYREIPLYAIGAIAFALLYVLNPFDLIPDAIPVLGQLDDAAVVGLCLRMVEKDLHAYRAWKAQQANAQQIDAPQAKAPQALPAAQTAENESDPA